ncbi:MAG TPA: hypothetical protein VLS92_10940 [Acidimicrobiia bacterium]|nr:hypothetical protein [Acidimicrobiia bacterium]
MDAAPPTGAPLRVRLPGYLVAFALGLAAGGLVGVVVWLATSVRITDAVGYTFSALGALLLLVGGFRGSGHGLVGSAMPGGDELQGSPEAMRRLEAIERRRRRLLAPPDPSAFWQVVAGFAYLGLGVGLNLLFASAA